MCAGLCQGQLGRRGCKFKESGGWSKGEYDRTGNRSQRDLQAMVRVLLLDSVTEPAAVTEVEAEGSTWPPLKGVLESIPLTQFLWKNGPVFPWAERQMTISQLQEKKQGWVTH